MTAPDNSLLARLPVAAYACNRDGIVTSYNEYAARLWGREAGAHDRFTPVPLRARDGAPLAADATPAARALAEGRDIAAIEVTIEPAAGRCVHALAFATPLRDASGAVDGVVCVLADVTARAQNERAKDDLLAMLGHDLRNPLGPVRNAVQILRGRAADAQTTWALDLIERQVDEIVGVIEVVSEVSRLARGAVKPVRAPYEVAAVVDAAVAAARPTLERRGQPCEIAVEPADARADGDAARTEQAVRTLLCCAAKSLPNGATVGLDVSKRNDRVAFAIGARTGGERSEMAARLPPEAAVQVALARGLTELLGGKLSVEGTLYELSLPAS